MQFPTARILTLLTLAATGLAQSTGTASYDESYDDRSRSTLTLACSDGINGLATKGYPTLGSLPSFARVGAASAIAGWNSENCGKCYAVTWAGKGTTIAVAAVDRATADGFVLSLAALNLLTGGLGKDLGRVDITWVETSPVNCGF